MQLATLPMPTTRPDAAVAFVQGAVAIPTVIAMNAMAAAMGGKPLTPALLVNQLDQLPPALTELVAATRALAPDVEPQFLAAEQAISGVAALVAKASADTTTVLDEAGMELFMSEFMPHVETFIATAKALDPNVPVGDGLS